jgi:hypothetical protein
MRDDRTPEQRYAAWVQAVNKCHICGWKCIDGWIFQSPSGSRHDLSGMNLDMLADIEKNKHSLVLHCDTHGSTQ